ncbi:MAG: hypothetical protein JNK21_07665 [Rhodospirillaceae bacterium]|nr:hypothetical protein [Rhodospirillaceae bacterium]
MRVVLMAQVLMAGLAFSAAAQEVKQNAVSTAGAPTKTDAEPGYWTNLFENTMRFTVMHPAGKQVIDTYYNRDKTVTTDAGFSGTWRTEGEAGKEMFCYDLSAFSQEPKVISECFPLRLMNNPRIGAKWGGKMKPGVPYQAIVVAGREKDPRLAQTK